MVLCIEVLRGALGVAVKKQMLERNVATRSESPRQTTTARRMLTPGEAKALLAKVQGDRLAAHYQLALTLAVLCWMGNVGC